MSAQASFFKIATEVVARARQSRQAAVRLVAASKTRTVAEIEGLIALGQRDFGENRVQEARVKWPELLERYPDVRLRLIGPLQSNKVKYLPGLFHAIDSLDRVSLAETLARIAERSGYRPECLVQINTGEEDQKAGIAPQELGVFLRHLERLDLKVCGLMCLPPVDEVASIHFAFLRKLADDHGLVECSMGMSGDYAEAIALGATMVRIGTALFGARS